ncbi:hypothetical protein ACFL6G_08095 [candidate division KSB1 bacterium]
MDISSIENSPFSSQKSPKADNPEYRKELAGLRRNLLSSGMSDAQRTEMQAVLRQAEQALEKGNTFSAREFLDQANQTFEQYSNTASDEPGVSDSSPAYSFKNPETDKRTYQDSSGDPNVSFKFPRKINEYQANIAVKAHEGEHVRDAVFKAQNEKTLASVQIRYHYGMDSKGKRFLKGGTTKVSFPTRNIHVKLRQINSNKVNKKV